MRLSTLATISAAGLGCSVLLWAVSYARPLNTAVPWGRVYALDGVLYCVRPVIRGSGPQPCEAGMVDLQFVLPLWPVPLALAVLPGMFVVGTLRRRRKERRGGCLRCGYDLRGLTVARCPECGQAFERAAEPRTAALP